MDELEVGAEEGDISVFVGADNAAGLGRWVDTLLAM